MEKDGYTSGSEDSGGSGDDAEWKTVALMRAYVEGKDPTAKEVDNFMLRRFLRARNLDIEKASTMFLNYLKWWKESVPRGFISDEDVRNELNQKKMFLQGFDKKGRPIGVVLGAKHHCYKHRQMNEFKSSVVYIIEKLCSSMPRGQEKFTVIADLQGWGFSNSDMRGSFASQEILQNYYPERLGKVFLIHVPSLFMKAWKVLYPFIDSNTREKYVFVEDKSLKSTLLADIDEDQLPNIYGGKLQLVPIDEAGK